MAWGSSVLCVPAIDLDNETLFNEYQNDFPSTSDEETDQQKHVSVNTNQDSNPIPTLPPMVNVNNVNECVTMY